MAALDSLLFARTVPWVFAPGQVVLGSDKILRALKSDCRFSTKYHHEGTLNLYKIAYLSCALVFSSKKGLILAFMSYS